VGGLLRRVDIFALGQYYPIDVCVSKRRVSMLLSVQV
jgi:hypothetical protein